MNRGIAEMGPTLPEVSVLMPHRGCEDYLREAVECILNQVDVRVELLLVDDASDSNLWLEKIEDLIDGETLRVFRTDRNVGPYRIKNALLEIAKAPYIAFQDADDLSCLTRLRTQLDYLASSKAEVVGTGFRTIDEDGETTGYRKMKRFPNLWHRLGKGFLCFYPSIVVCKSVFERIGGFDGTTKIAADSDFALRAAYCSKIKNLPKFLYHYRLREGSLTQAADTGMNSSKRRTYYEAVLKRWKEQYERFRKEQDYAALQVPSNDVPFKLIPVGPSSFDFEPPSGFAAGG